MYFAHVMVILKRYISVMLIAAITLCNCTKGAMYSPFTLYAIEPLIGVLAACHH